MAGTTKSGTTRRTTGGRATQVAGGSTVTAAADEASLRGLLGALEEMRSGNFRRRLPTEDDGVLAEIARAYNEVAERNAHLAAELRRVRRTVGRDGRLEERLDAKGATGAWASWSCTTTSTSRTAPSTTR